jgi:hypothetical protein
MESIEKDLPAKYEGHILGAEAYPRDDETISLHLMYHDPATPPSDNKYRGQRFEISKSDAEALAVSIFEILAAPDAQTAWENIAKDLHEGDHEQP